MLRGRWSAENRAALEELLARKWDAPPVAVFDWDETAILGDTSDLVFHELCRALAFDFDDPEFERWIDELPVPTRIPHQLERWRAQPSRESHDALRFELERTRHALHLSEDDNQAWAWDSGAFVGWTPSAGREFTRRVIARELSQPRRKEILVSRDADAIEMHRAMQARYLVHQQQELVEGEASVLTRHEVRLELARGVRLRPEIRELMAEFRRAGWRVMVISASPQLQVEAFAERYFVPSQNVVGMRRAVRGGRVTADIEPPVSWGDGKLDAYRMFVSRARPPQFVAGDGVGDWTLLEWATECALLVEPARAALRDFAHWKKSIGETWLIQRFDE